MKVLDIDLAVQKGYLFINLNGSLSKDSTSKLTKMLKILKNVGIKNIIVNINNVSVIDDYGKNIILNICTICKESSGNFYIYARNKSAFESLNKLIVPREDLLA